MEGEDWRHQAACQNEYPDLFFPVGKTGHWVYQIQEAKEVCRGCEVREQCLEWSLENNLDYGIWGGLDEEERRELRRKRKRALGRASLL